MQRSSYFLTASTIALALTASAQTASTVGPVAHVYVSTTSGAVFAYNAAKNGALTSVTGSPFKTSLLYLANNGKYLFGIGTDIVHVYTYAIAKNGAIHFLSSVNAQAHNNPPNDGGPVSLSLDHTGANLYVGDIYADGANNGYQFYAIGPNGVLHYLGLSSPLNVEIDLPLWFSPDNQFAYNANCVKFDPTPYGYRRKAGGTLQYLFLNPTIPSTNQSGTGYCTGPVATGRSNQLVMALTPGEPYTFTGPSQLAIYSIHPDGSLTTGSTAVNMPKSNVHFVADMKFDPSGKYVAVAGDKGLQLFRFNGVNPLTRLGNPATGVEIDQLTWDNANHLYALSSPYGTNAPTHKLFLFTLKNGRLVPAPGSPRNVPKAFSVTVAPLTAAPK
jgi:hypothetical protein